MSDVRDLFRDRFGGGPAGLWQAPGRVNLIGEHTDYNDGFVLPLALPMVTRAAAARRDDGRLRMWSVQQAPDEAVQAVLAWLATGSSEAEIAFQPARLLMHDTTSTPALVDIAAMRDALAEAGGRFAVQDEATSVVWGMPGAAAATGQAEHILPLADIAPWIRRIAGAAQ